MKLYQIAINSLWRRKARFAFLLFGLMLTVGTVVLLINLAQTMNEDIAQKLDTYGANILIVPKSDDLSLTYGGMSVSGVSFDVRELRQDDLALIRSIKNEQNIKLIAPKLLGITKIQSDQALVMGVDFTQELELKRWWKIDGIQPSQNNEALIGSEVQKKFHFGLGQTININDQNYKITGVLNETGSQDDGLIIIDLKEAQHLFKKTSAISMIEVAALCYDCPIEEIVAQISEKLPNAKVTAIQQTIQSRMDSLDQFEKFSTGISAILLMISAIIVFTSVSAAVNERRREIGILRAIGYRQIHIIHVILFESFLISVFAGMLGYLSGLFSSGYIEPLLGANISLASFNIDMLSIALLISVGIGMLASIYPSVRAARMDPAITIRAL